MDKYLEILTNQRLYPERVISRFAEPLPKWNLMSSHSREKMAAHIMSCLLMCNMELVTDYFNTGSRKRNVRDSEAKGPHPKKAKEMESAKSTAGPSEASSSGSSTLSDDMLCLEENGETKEVYRFSLLRYHPLPEPEMCYFSQMWGIRTPSTMWDIVDREEKSFVRLSISTNKEREATKYFSDSLDCHGHTALIIINPTTTEIEIKDMAKKPKGLSKLIAFITSRRNDLLDMGIIETDVQESDNLIETILCSNNINKAVSEWEEDLIKTMDEKWSVEELSRGTEEGKGLRTITPKALLKRLDDLEGRDPTNKTKWRGKILPEGYVHNIHLESSTDYAMVDEILSFISSLDFYEPECHGFKKPIEGDVLDEILQQWRNSTSTNSFMFALTTNKTIPHLLKMTGHRMKSREFVKSNDGMEQPDYTPISPQSYDETFEEIIEVLNFDHPFEGHVPYEDLLEEPENDNHPIAIISEEACTALMKEILKSNSAVFSQKMTNLYSRLGGAYSSDTRETNRTKSSLAVFPIYSVLKPLDDEKDTKIRVGHGICIRGPSHPKSPTDRISFVTVEIVPNDQFRIIRTYKCGVTYRSRHFSVVVRPNSIMKEDSTYCTFTHNALFGPLNTFGCMTIENENIKPNENMRGLMKNTIEEHSFWFRERFTEGVLFAAIGNSRDEGYFSLLRKLFMIVLQLRRGNASASWDLDSFCKKTNECLIDNPISMHFHKQILDVLALYDKRMKKVSP